MPSEGCLPSEPITLRGTAATLLRRVIGSKQHRLPASAGVLGSNYARACSLLFLKSHPSLGRGIAVLIIEKIVQTARRRQFWYFLVFFHSS